MEALSLPFHVAPAPWHPQAVETFSERVIRLLSNLPIVTVFLAAESGWPIEYISDSISAYGYDPLELRARRVSFNTLVSHEDQSHLGQELRACGGFAGKSIRCALSLVGTDGKRHHCSSVWEVQRGHQGTNYSVAGLLVDNEGMQMPNTSACSNPHSSELSLLKAEDLMCLFVHDLRSPLTVLMGSCDILALRTAAADATISAPLKTMRAETQRLHELCEDLMLSVRLTQGMVRLVRGPIGSQHLLKLAMAEYGPIAASKGVTLFVEESSAELMINVDRRLCQRALGALLLNSIKRSTSGQKVKISCRVNRSRGDSSICVEFRISDNGAALPHQARAQFFDKYAISDLRSQGLSHLGIGLCLVKTIAKAHGGDTTIEASPNGEEVFILQLQQ